LLSPNYQECRSCCLLHLQQSCHLAKVLSDCGERELVLSASWSAQSQSAHAQDAFEVRERHLDFLSMTSGLLEGFGFGQSAGHIPSRLVDVPCHLPPYGVWAAAVFHWTRLTCVAISEVAQSIVGVVVPDLFELLAGWADVLLVALSNAKSVREKVRSSRFDLSMTGTCGSIPFLYTSQPRFSAEP
jgi:hypothetical protein